MFKSITHEDVVLHTKSQEDRKRKIKSTYLSSQTNPKQFDWRLNHQKVPAFNYIR